MKFCEQEESGAINIGRLTFLINAKRAELCLSHLYM